MNIKELAVLTLFIVCTLLSANATYLQCDNSNPEMMEIIEYMVDTLGYEYEYGEILFNNFDNNNKGLITSEFFIPFVNLDSDYGVSFFSSTKSTCLHGIRLPGTSLSGRDIILFRGCTPPQVSYFSYRSYLAASVIGPLSDGLDAFNFVQSSLGDSINHLVIKTDKNDGPFDTKTSIVTTGFVN